MILSLLSDVEAGMSGWCPHRALQPGHGWTRPELISRQERRPPHPPPALSKPLSLILGLSLGSS